jgi:hypothetical protein
MKRIPKAAYTLEFKLEALRRVRGGEAVRGGAERLGYRSNQFAIG